MIVSGTVASPAAGPALPSWVNAPTGPADENPPNGAGAMGLNGKWVLDPGESFIVTTLTNAAAQAIDWSVAGCFLITLGTNTTFTFVNSQVGSVMRLVLTQDGTGSRTGTFPAGSVFVGGSKTLTTTASGIDTVDVMCTGAGTYLCSLLKAYA